jgi:hypothetical protein
VCMFVRVRKALPPPSRHGAFQVVRCCPDGFIVTLNNSSVEVRTRKMVNGGFLMQVGGKRANRRGKKRGVCWTDVGEEGGWLSSLHLIPLPLTSPPQHCPPSHSPSSPSPSIAPFIHSQVDGENHVIHVEEEALGTRLMIDTSTCLLSKEVDLSRIIATSAGKLVRWVRGAAPPLTAGRAGARAAQLHLSHSLQPISFSHYLLCSFSPRLHFPPHPPGTWCPLAPTWTRVSPSPRSR